VPAGIYAYDAGKALGLVSGSPFSPTVSGPITFSSDSKFLYTTDGTGYLAALAAFSIGSDGSLSPVPGSPFTTPEGLQRLVANPTSDFLYGMGVSGVLRVFAIDSASGAPSLLSSVNGVGAEAMTVTPDGRYLYLVVEQQSNSQLVGFAVDAATGALSPVPGPLTVPVRGPGSVVVEATGKFLYLVDYGSGLATRPCCVYGFAIDASTGSLSQLPGAPFDVGGTVDSMAASGRYLIAAIIPQPVISSDTCTLSVISVDQATGALSSVPGSPSGQLCGSVAAASSLPYVYDGVGYESQTGSTIFAYSLDDTSGALTPLDTAHVPEPNIGMVAVVH
jgi:6-phosphogluconolactonase (cycloisomerase 2 family)